MGLSSKVSNVETDEKPNLHCDVGKRKEMKCGNGVSISKKSRKPETDD